MSANFQSKLLFLLGSISLGLLIISACTWGFQKIPLTKTVQIIGHGLGFFPPLGPESTLDKTIILEVRLPRILCAALVGGGLGMSGAIFQGILKNPLADPYTLGVSAGAAFGASLALIFDLHFLGGYTVPACAFGAAILTLFSVIFLSSSAGSLSSTNLILSGVIITAILSAGISFMKYLAQEKVSIIIFWLLGSFTSSSWKNFFWVGSLLFPALALAIFFSRELNLISLGEREAVSLGVNTEKVRLFFLCLGSAVAASCVAISGIIGFVGLLIPHLLRFLVGPDHRILLPLSFIFGALLLLCADTITRAFLPSEVPIGVLTSLLGGPFFCYIFRQHQFRQQKC